MHRGVGLIDVSTLGKLLVAGPDAGAFLDRIYPNRFSDLKHGRIRYGVITSDGGRIMDDGTVARLDDERVLRDDHLDRRRRRVPVVHVVERGLGDGRPVPNVTGAVAAVNVAGPQARTLMERVSADDFSNEGFAYLDAKHVTVAGVPTLALRIGFVGELGYELHFPSPHGEHVWDTLLEQGVDLEVAPFGLEPQRILRLEKGHVIIGQDTDSESNLLEAAMPWIVKADKPDFVGKWAVEQVAERGLRWMLVGFESPRGAMPVEGGQVVVDGVVGRARDERAPQRRAGQGDRPRRRPAELAEEGGSSTSQSTASSSRWSSTSGRSSIPPARG